MARYYAKLDLEKTFEAAFSLPLFTGDSGNTVALEFFNGGEPYDMSGAQIYARRPDGMVLTTAAVTSGNRAEFTLYNNMFSCLGELQVQVSILDVYGNFLTSGVLYFTVQEGFSSQSQGEGSDDFCDLTALIRQVGEGLGQIERAELAASKGEELNEEMQEFLQEYSNIENQVIVNLTETELDSFLNGVGLVTSSNGSDGVLATEMYQWIVVAENTMESINLYSTSQTRFYEGTIQKRTGTYFQDVINGGDWTSEWGDWTDINQPAYDLIFNESTELSEYAGKTISGKTIFFQSNQSLESEINITFSSCIIYGNRKSIGTWGLTKFTNCVMYDLDFSSPIIWGDETNDYTTTAGSCSCTGCNIYGGSIWDYWDPSFSGCKVTNCAISGYGQTFSTKDSVYINCDFNGCGPVAMAENEYNVFTNCYHFGGYSALTGQCYFSGCRGSVRVSSEAALKPSTTTAFADQNFADLTID